MENIMVNQTNKFIHLTKLYGKKNAQKVDF